MTESMRMRALSAADFISSARRSSRVVGACTTSKPTSAAILKRSAWLIPLGSMLYTKPFLIEDAPEEFAASSDFVMAPLAPATPIAATEDFRNSRRDAALICSSSLPASRSGKLIQVELGIEDLF